MNNVRELRPLNLTEEQRRDVIATLDRMVRTCDRINDICEDLKTDLNDSHRRSVRRSLRVLPGGAV